MARILLTGGSGRLGTALRACIRLREDLSVWAPTSRECDVRDNLACKVAVEDYRPDVVIHAAAYCDAAGCERDPKRAFSVNVHGAANMARACMRSTRSDVRLIFISTDYVFSGDIGNYPEHTQPSPLNEYGRTKRDAERLVMMDTDALILRAPFRADPPWRYPRAFTDQWTSCRFVSQVAPDILRAALMSELTGILHIGGPRRSIYDLAREASPEVGAMTRAEFSGVRLPRDTSLDSSKWHSILEASTRSSQLAAIST